MSLLLIDPSKPLVPPPAQAEADHNLQRLLSREVLGLNIALEEPGQPFRFSPMTPAVLFEDMAAPNSFVRILRRGAVRKEKSSKGTFGRPPTAPTSTSSSSSSVSITTGQHSPTRGIGLLKQVPKWAINRYSLKPDLFQNSLYLEISDDASRSRRVGPSQTSQCLSLLWLMRKETIIAWVLGLEKPPF